MPIAQGQITIIDYNDAITLTSFISSNQVKTQIYNPDNGTYNPSWESSPYLILTPSLYKAGNTTDIITSAKSITWYDGSAPSTALTNSTTYVIGSVATGGKLTVKANTMATVNSKDYICEIVYNDASTGLDVVAKSTISFSKLQNGEGIVAAVAMCEDGNVFKNSDVAQLTATCDLYRGGATDTTNVSYQWYIQNPSQTSTAYAPLGTGWSPLSTTANKYKDCTSRKMTIYPAAVTNVAVFACIITDTDSASTTYNQKYVDTVTIIDNTDPYYVDVTSTGGDVFKNGTGSTTLTAHVYQAGKEIDTAGTQFNYTWKKYSNGNSLVNFYGTSSSSKTGKTLSINGNDVDVKNTFICEISEK